MIYGYEMARLVTLVIHLCMVTSPEVTRPVCPLCCLPLRPNSGFGGSCVMRNSKEIDYLIAWTSENEKQLIRSNS